MALGTLIRDALIQIHQEGGFEEIREIRDQLVTQEQLDPDVAAHAAVDLFDGLIDFDRMMNGKWERLGDWLERNDGNDGGAGVVLRPLIRLGLKRLLGRRASVETAG